MTLSLKQLILISIFILGFLTAYPQLGFSNELGIVVGPIVFQSDFGERHNFETNTGNLGFGIGFLHYMNFDYRSRGYAPYSYFNDHFKIRSELSWNRAKLNHFGTWVEGQKNGINADKLRAHSGQSNNIDLGMQLEYFPISIKEFSYAINSFAPYISLGIHYSLFSPRVFTSYGNQNPHNLDNFYGPWYRLPDGTVRDKDFIITQTGGVFSIVGSIGSRYKLTRMSDLFVDFRLQHYFNDKVDGLNHKLPSNKSNDYLFWIGFGYIQYLN